MNRYSFSTGALFPLETAEALRLVKAAGFDNAEMMPQAFDDVSEKSTLEFERAGVRVASVHYPLAMFGMLYTAHRSMMEDGRAFSRKLVSMGSRLGMRVLVVHPHSPAPAGYEALLEQPVIDNLLWLAELCARHGVVMAMENHPATCPTAEKLLAYVRRLGHPAIKPMVDVTEACEAGEDPVAFVSAAKPCHLHLSDFTGKVKHLPAGEGTIDWHGIRRALATAKYQGLYTLEPAYRFYLDDIENKLRKAHAFISGLIGE